MQNKEQIFLYMKEEIEQLAITEETKILEEANALEEKAYKMIKEEAKKEAEKELEKELTEISVNAKMEASATYDTSMQEIYALRKGYVASICKEAKRQLQEYGKSDAYKQYLIQMMQDVQKEYPNYFTNVYIRKEDMQYLPTIQQIFGQNISVQESDEIVIGGFSVENIEMKTWMNKTLDAALMEQYEWMHRLPALQIRMDEVN